MRGMKKKETWYLYENRLDIIIVPSNSCFVSSSLFLYPCGSCEGRRGKEENPLFRRTAIGWVYFHTVPLWG